LSYFKTVNVFAETIGPQNQFLRDQFFLAKLLIFIEYLGIYRISILCYRNFWRKRNGDFFRGE